MDVISGTENRCIIVFMKAPEQGRVKTRLSESVEDDVVLDLYKAFVKDVLMKAETCGGVMIEYYPSDSGQFVREFVGHGYPLKPQHGGGLGDKMKNAFDRVFGENITRALLIGTDIPDIPVSMIEEAFTVLDDNDAVIMPVNDGGYCLIGFNSKSFCPEVFDDVVWSSSIVFEQTMKRMKRYGIRCHVLPEWHDIDTVKDLSALSERLLEGRTLAPNTLTVIENHHERIRHYTGPERS